MLIQKKFWTGITSVAVVAILIFCSRLKSERKYEGKTLSEWVYQYGGEYEKAVRDRQPVEQTEAAYAIRLIGTNAVPQLIALMLDDPPQFAVRFWVSKSPIFGPLRMWTWEHCRKRFATANAAQQALTLFPRQQAQIVPALSNVVVNRTRNPEGLDQNWWPPGSVHRSVDLMQHMYPFGTSTLGILLTNSSTPTPARIYIATRRFEQFPMKNNPELTMAVKAGFNSPDIEIRSLATNLLVKAQVDTNGNR